MNILIIEDEPLIAKSLAKLLSLKQHEVVTTPSGSAAIDLILQKDYDRIVCDLMLQDISGFDVIEESKKKYTQEIIKEKFIIMTAYSSEQIMEKAKSYECIILQKPFNSLKMALQLITGAEIDE